MINSQIFSNTQQKETAYNKKESEYEVETKNVELESIKLKEVELEIELKDIKIEEISRKVRHKFCLFVLMSIFHLLSAIISNISSVQNTSHLVYSYITNPGYKK